ncbi:alpha/beta hydrolase [Aldersonia sp. NBC_00410]|uniref:alpha/beta hydrolase n=1 Tax=Aldersonia sp. NBC_00410 TaxID=2975954 RepID=UPI00224F824E|nr:alpha/beta hydrolase [Aldersonia sp. NBC_00410]MCX5045664.1 alpha/beta hydrolase [Aldersonia sp. NBC_00410]
MYIPNSRGGRAVGRALLGGAALVLIVGSAAACGSDTTGTARPDPLDRFAHQPLIWGSCADMGVPDGDYTRAFECTRVTVPVDYANADGPTASIAVSRVRATGAKVGSLLVNPGGPGGSGLIMAGIGADSAIGERFDVIGFDPRGIGASTPSIRCLTGAEWDAERADVDVDKSPAGIAAAEQESRELAARCADRTGAEFLKHVGTYEVVRDMDIIRAALGEEKMNYLGYSYGTRIGSTYAETFPTRVRAMVLDGALDPNQDYIEQAIAQSAGFQKAFDAFVAECTQYTECPLGTDPAAADERYQALVRPLIATPVPTTDPRGLGYNDATTGTIAALYSPGAWPTLAAGLEELAQGRGDTLLALADLYSDRSASGTYGNQTDAQIAVRCVDDPRVTDPVVLGRADTESRAVAPFLDDGFGTGRAAQGICAFWPAPVSAPPAHAVDAPGLPNVVVVSTTGDPATPHEAGVALADELHGSLVTFEGTQHTVVAGGTSACVDEAVDAYLIEGTAPAPGLTCGPDAA